MICTKTADATMSGRSPVQLCALVATWVVLNSAWGVLDEVENIENTMEWTNPGGWSTGSIPGLGQRAIINNGTLSVTGSNPLGFLTLSGNGALTGAGSLILEGTGDTSEWIGGAGLTGLTLQIAAGAQLNISGTGNRDLHGATLGGAGTVYWTGGLIRTGDASLIEVGTFIDATTNGTLNTALGGPPGALHIAPDASYLREGSGLTTLHVFLENLGLLALSSGNLVLHGGSSFGSDASVSLSTATELRLGSGSHALPTADIFSGPGTLRVASGATVDAHGNLNVNLALQDTGTLSGHLTLKKAFTVTGGSLTAGGSTTLAGTAQAVFSSPSNFDFGGHDLIFAGDSSILWSAGNLRTGGGATVSNAGTFVTTHNGTFADSLSGTATLLNSGTFAKTGGTGTTTVNLPVTNTGDIVAESGELRFQQTVTFASGKLVLAGGHLRFDQTLTAGAATTLTGDGTLIGHVHAHGVINPEAHLTVDGDLTLLTTSQLLFALNAADGLTSTQLTVTGTLLLGGSLFFDFVSSDRPGPTDFVVLATGTTLAGSLANVSSGGRLFLPGGNGSFEVHYGSGSAFGANNLALANFEFTPIPEPTTALLLGLGLGWLLLRRRRREATR